MSASQHLKGGGRETHDLSDTEMMVCRNMGIDPKKFAEQKKRHPPAAHTAMDPLSRTNAAPAPAANADGLNLTAQEREVARKMDLDPKKFAEQKKRHPPAAHTAMDPLSRTNAAPATAANADGLDLSAEEREVARKMNIDPKKFAEWKKKHPQATPFVRTQLETTTTN
jgi:L-rhamnose mutarotase